MVKRRKWCSKEKSRIVLEGLKGAPVSELCIEHQISQSMYYAWRDQFLTNMGHVFDITRHTAREKHLKHQNDQLKNMTGSLTYELKKNDDEDW